MREKKVYIHPPGLILGKNSQIAFNYSFAHQAEPNGWEIDMDSEIPRPSSDSRMAVKSVLISAAEVKYRYRG